MLSDITGRLKQCLIGFPEMKLQKWRGISIRTNAKTFLELKTLNLTTPKDHQAEMGKKKCPLKTTTVRLQNIENKKKTLKATILKKELKGTDDQTGSRLPADCPTAMTTRRQ